MKKKNLLLTFLLAALILGGGAKALAQSLFGKESSQSNYDYSTHQSLMRGGSGTGFDLGGVTNNENPTETTPLGSGIAMLVAAGAGYALLKRKEEQQ